MKSKIRFTLACTVVALTMAGAAAQAKTLGTWDRKIAGASRFKVVLDGAGVLDKETGLVWEKSPSAGSSNWQGAQFNCLTKFAGGRFGWRLPTFEELASLVDPFESNPSLQAGHPFVALTGTYWSATTAAGNTAQAWNINFDVANFGVVSKLGGSASWCVRGQQAYDGQ